MLQAWFTYVIISKGTRLVVVVDLYFILVTTEHSSKAGQENILCYKKCFF